jgi:hypothetical protein
VQTPAAEQQNPVKYLGLFASLAHQHGYKVIETPARDLGNRASPVREHRPEPRRALPPVQGLSGVSCCRG